MSSSGTRRIHKTGVREREIGLDAGGRFEGFDRRGDERAKKVGFESCRGVCLFRSIGAIRKKYDDLRERIVYCLAMVEAIIDFGEGEEIEDGVWEK
ncbi:mitochondrial splicing system protein, partial [Tulasnella sp. 417]